MCIVYIPWSYVWVWFSCGRIIWWRWGGLQTQVPSPLFYEVILCYLEKGSGCTRFLLFSFYNWWPESLMIHLSVVTNLITQFWSPCQSKNINNNVIKQWILSSRLSVLKWTSSKNTPILTMEYSNAFWQRNLVILCLTSVALKYNSWWWKPLHWYFRQGNN